MSFDFLVIGAMRSGTTTIHDLLKEDPRIALPVSKEIPFFTDDRKLKKGFNSFLREYYPVNSKGKCIGKVSPQYMTWYEVASANIARYSPETKLIAILRDPIDRLVSHYSMCVARGLEGRSINEAIKDCLNLLNKKNVKITPTNSYILLSRYGLILNHYCNLIDIINIKIISFIDLVNNQQKVINDIYQHIGLTPIPLKEEKKSLGKGRNQKKLTFTGWLANSFPHMFKGLVRTTPKRWRGALVMKRIEAAIHLNSPRISANDINEDLRARLNGIFREDGELLKRIGYTPYWLKNG